jgi:hypothetical protein
MKKENIFKIGDLFRSCKEKKTWYLRDIDSKNVFLENSHDPGHMITENITTFRKSYQLEAMK